MNNSKVLTILFYISIILFVSGMCLVNLYPDNDLWARLIAGKYIVSTGTVLKNDFLSYTPVHPWYDHEWGASVFIYSALRYFGDAGLLLLKCILAVITMLFCIKTVELNKKNPVEAHNILYYALMIFVASNILGAAVRCLMFTCAFFAAFLYILERARLGKSKSLILLPIMMLFWCNIHGGCMAGFALLGIYSVGEFLNHKPFKHYIYTLLACFAVLFINPYGIDYVKFLFFAATMKRELISEWLSPFISIYKFDYLRYKFYLLFLLATQIGYWIKTKPRYCEIDKTKLLVILFVTFISVTKIRHQTFFIFTAGTLLYDEFYYLLNSLIDAFKRKFNFNFERISFIKNIIIYVFILSVSLFQIFIKDNEIRITEVGYPRFAVEFIKINNIKGNLLVNFNWGSYTAYKLYPNNLIFMDGRYEEVYYPKLLEEMKKFHMLKDDWQKVIRDYNTEIMIIDKKYPVYEKIKNMKDWSIIFENNLSGVFVPSNKVRDNYLYPAADDKYYNSTKFNTNINFLPVN